MFEIYYLYNCELNKEYRVQAEDYRRLHPARPASPRRPLMLRLGEYMVNTGNRIIGHITTQPIPDTEDRSPVYRNKTVKTQTLL
ncbi:transcriptional regulator [Dehalococcoides mccartyi]|uniref:transcriptional regulator n=1 Tax=Dehalococcoides mccartyi TaxID=61435 RepID=UPI0009901FAF|nr:transcriptional regulator [Dehalococcoides mccartyi]AQU05668.1 transcriptional regulator [Dehalococcoides mccartyi]AQU07114.1 transcriptional regulator [Dehalococcoides mccartyi]